MRGMLLYCTLTLAALSFVMWRLQPGPRRDGKYELVWVSDDNPARQGQADLFNRTNSHYRVVVDPSNADVEKVIVQSIAGVGPDLIDSYDAFQLSAYVKAGIVLDLTDELKRRGINVQRDCFPGMLGACVFEGHVYGVPCDVAADGIWYHREMFRKAGIQPPTGHWTWEDLARLAQKLTLHDASGRVTQYGFFFDWNWKHFLRTYGARIFTPDGTRCIIDSPRCVAAAAMMHDLMYKYKVCPTPAEQASMSTRGGWGSGSISWFGGRRAAMALGGRWWLASLRSYSGLHLGVIESPWNVARQYHGYGRATLVNKATHHLQGCLDWLDYLATPAYNRLVNDQADAICGFKKYASGPRFLFNPQYPEETDNAIWRTITDHSVPDEASPFVDGDTVNRLVTDQITLLEENEKTPGQAMADAARNVNQAIAAGLEEDPSLAARYLALTQGRPQ